MSLRVRSTLTCKQWAESGVEVQAVSSNVESLRYELETMRLWVGFNNGSMYYYEGVPQTLAELLYNAPSLGIFLHAHIKGRFPFTRVR